MTLPPGTPERPLYAKARQRPEGDRVTGYFMVTVDEGWRQSIVCDGMYEWVADWLVEVLQGRPYAPGHEDGIGTIELSSRVKGLRRFTRRRL